MLKKPKRLKTFRHTFSHFHLDITPVVAVVNSPPTKRVADTAFRWFSLGEPIVSGFSSADYQNY